MSSSSSTKGYCTCRNPECNMCGPDFDPFVGYPYTPTTPMMPPDMYQDLLYAEERQNAYEEKVILYQDQANAVSQEIKRKEKKYIKKDQEVKKATQLVKDGKKWLKDADIWLKEKVDEMEKKQQKVYTTEARRVAEEEYIYATKSKYPQQFPNLD